MGSSLVQCTFGLPHFSFWSWAFSDHCSVFNDFMCVVTGFQGPSCLTETKAKIWEVFCSHKASVLGFTRPGVLTRQQMMAFLSCHVLFQGPCSVPEVKIKACWGLTTKIIQARGIHRIYHTSQGVTWKPAGCRLGLAKAKVTEAGCSERGGSGGRESKARQIGRLRGDTKSYQHTWSWYRIIISRQRQINGA